MDCIVHGVANGATFTSLQSPKGPRQCPLSQGTRGPPCHLALNALRIYTEACFSKRSIAVEGDEIIRKEKRSS